MSISSGRPNRPAMADFEVHIDLNGRTRQIGLARSNRGRGTETIIFRYDGTWLEDPDRFSLEPALALGHGAFAPPAGLATFGSIGDSAPDTWGRRLMQRAERRRAEREGPSRSHALGERLSPWRGRRDPAGRIALPLGWGQHVPGSDPRGGAGSN